MWVVDDSILGIKIVCRKSQEKFNVNETFLESDDFYSTVDINSWDEKPEKGHLVSDVSSLRVPNVHGLSHHSFVSTLECAACTNLGAARCSTFVFPRKS